MTDFGDLSEVIVEERVVLEKFEGEPAEGKLLERITLVNGELVAHETFENGELVDRREGGQYGAD